MTESLPLKCTWKACCCGFLASDTHIAFRKQLGLKECEIPRGSLFPFLSFGGQWLREMVCFGRIELQTRQGWTSCLFVITLLGLGWSISQWQVEFRVRTLQQIKSQFGACSGFGFFSLLTGSCRLKAVTLPARLGRLCPRSWFSISAWPVSCSELISLCYPRSGCEHAGLRVEAGQYRGEEEARTRM